VGPADAGVEQLGELQNLRTIILPLAVSDEAVKRLQQRLPRAHIARYP
jgi:hypothetical protein